MSEASQPTTAVCGIPKGGSAVNPFHSSQPARSDSDSSKLRRRNAANATKCRASAPSSHHHARGIGRAGADVTTVS